MSPTTDLISIEDLAPLGREQAVRRRFDQLNLKTARVVTVFLSVFSLAFNPPFQPWVPFVAGLQLLLCWIFFFALGRVIKGLGAGEGKTRWLHPIAEWIRRRPRVSVMSLVPAVFALMAGRTLGDAATDNIAGWAAVMVIFLAFIRLTTAERLVLHGLITGTALLFELARPVLDLGSPDWPNLIAACIFSLIFFAIGQFRTLRFRRETLRQWETAQRQHGEQVRIRQELEYAREIQLSMLPEKSPEIAWLEVASLSLPAAEVGGDYYDFFEIDEDRLAVVIGDVAGHGFSSGLLLSGVRSCLTLLVDEIGQPLEVMEKLHRMVKSTMRHRMLVTLAIVLIDRSEGTAVITSAGHPPVLVARAAGGVEEMEVRSLPLGAGLADGFAQRQVDLEKGDALLLYTDGIYETESEDGDFYGLERMTRVLDDQKRGATAEEIREGLLSDLWGFKGVEAQGDDITMVVLRLRP